MITNLARPTTKGLNRSSIGSKESNEFNNRWPNSLNTTRTQTCPKSKERRGKQRSLSLKCLSIWCLPRGRSIWLMLMEVTLKASSAVLVSNTIRRGWWTESRLQRTFQGVEHNWKLWQILLRVSINRNRCLQSLRTYLPAATSDHRLFEGMSLLMLMIMIEAIAHMMKGIWTTLCSTPQMIWLVPRGSLIMTQLATAARVIFQERKRWLTELATSTRWISKRCSVKISTNSLKTRSGILNPTKRWVSSHAAPTETTVRTTSSKQWRKSTCRKLRKIRTIPCSNLDPKLMWLEKILTLPDPQRLVVQGRSMPHVSSRIGSPMMHPSFSGDRDLLNSWPTIKLSPIRATQDPHPGTLQYAVRLPKRRATQDPHPRTPKEFPNKPYNPIASENR